MLAQHGTELHPPDGTHGKASESPGICSPRVGSQSDTERGRKLSDPKEAQGGSDDSNRREAHREPG